jgi:hypothetical protein
MFNFENSKKSILYTAIAVGLTLSSTAIYYFKFRKSSSPFKQVETKNEEEVVKEEEKKEE